MGFPDSADQVASWHGRISGAISKSDQIVMRGLDPRIHPQNRF
jgi:hypothetical protein